MDEIPLLHPCSRGEYHHIDWDTYQLAGRQFYASRRRGPTTFILQLLRVNSFLRFAVVERVTDKCRSICTLIIQVTIMWLTISKYSHSSWKTVPVLRLMFRDGTLAFTILTGTWPSSRFPTDQAKPRLYSPCPRDVRSHYTTQVPCRPWKLVSGMRIWRQIVVLIAFYRWLLTAVSVVVGTHPTAP